MERIAALRQVSEHKLFGRTYPEACVKNIEEIFDEVMRGIDIKGG